MIIRNPFLYIFAAFMNKGIALSDIIQDDAASNKIFFIEEEFMLKAGVGTPG